MDSLNNDLLNIIYSYYNFFDIYKMHLISKYYNNSISTSLIWQYLCEKFKLKLPLKNARKYKTFKSVVLRKVNKICYNCFNPGGKIDITKLYHYKQINIQINLLKTYACPINHISDIILCNKCTSHIFNNDMNNLLVIPFKTIRSKILLYMETLTDISLIKSNCIINTVYNVYNINHYLQEEEYYIKYNDLITILMRDDYTDVYKHTTKFIDICKEIVKYQQQKNKMILSRALKSKKLEYRADSVLCNQFIMGGNIQLDYVVNTMYEMKFYFNHTNYSEIMNDNIRQFKYDGILIYPPDVNNNMMTRDNDSDDDYDDYSNDDYDDYYYNNVDLYIHDISDSSKYSAIYGWTVKQIKTQLSLDEIYELVCTKMNGVPLLPEMTMYKYIKYIYDGYTPTNKKHKKQKKNKY